MFDTYAVLNIQGSLLSSLPLSSYSTSGSLTMYNVDINSSYSNKINNICSSNDIDVIYFGNFQGSPSTVTPRWFIEGNTSFRTSKIHEHIIHDYDIEIGGYLKIKNIICSASNMGGFYSCVADGKRPITDAIYDVSSTTMKFKDTIFFNTNGFKLYLTQNSYCEWYASEPSW